MKIAITMGDPAGIGPELILRTVSEFGPQTTFAIFGNRKLFKKVADDLRLRSNYRAIASSIVDVAGPVKFEYGRPTKKTAWVALRSIQAALESRLDTIITAPIVKSTMRLIAPGFIGHTEYFAKFFKVSDYAMTGLWENKRIMLLTIHVPLRRIFRQLTSEKIVNRIGFFKWGLERYFGVKDPMIAISAVNPHAFEFSLGEDEEIQRAVLTARKKGVRIDGPFPADTLFERSYDGHIAAYHDQAMIYLKSKKDGLNFTLGLPIIRLSPLCGAALDIAGRGCADVSGFAAAIRKGKLLYRNMRKYDEEN
jgi:4-hydroxy-L-threonine phosphate dehydrogenase PdxA